MTQRNKPSVSLMWALLLLAASCHSAASSAGEPSCPGCGTGGAPNLGTGGSAGTTSNSVNGGDADASGCPEAFPPVPPGCYSNWTLLTDPWFGWQLPDCVITFDTRLPIEILDAYVWVNCTLRYFTDGTDGNEQGFTWKVGPSWQTDMGSMATVTLTLSGEACDLVRANSDARVYVLLTTPACPGPTGPA